MQLTIKEEERYSRHILMSEIGIEGQEKLKKASVLVIGAGGLGCPVLQYLTAAGIGTIGVIDFDKVEESNLQRQILFYSSHVGFNKAQIAKEQLEKMNPFVTINAYVEKLDHENAIALFEKYDLIVDCTDNFDTRYLVNDAAILTNKAIVYGSIYQFEGQVSLFNHQNGPSYRCLFPNPSPTHTPLNCQQAGVLAVLPGIIGTYQANEVLKIILGLGDTLSGKLLLINIKKNSSSIMSFQRSKKQIDKVMLNGLKASQNQICSNSKKSINTITAQELYERLIADEKIQFIDVREQHEQVNKHTLLSLCIPMGELLNRATELDSQKLVVLFCQSGIRSKVAIQQLQDKLGYTNLYNLEGGINAWTKIEKEKVKIELL
ncbi:MAG: HesA/MoeB/ThiF family protein [Flavobacteriales bacterium]|nr:HesA/MoeB/ThiF family protein [Flavobacteriales bacterium]